MILLRQAGDPRWRKAPAVFNAVGLLTSEGSRRYGHCIRVSERWILTAHHVLDIPELAERFRVERLGFLTPEQKPGHSCRLDPHKGGFFCSEDGIQGQAGDGFDLDYAFVRLAGPFSDADPSGFAPIIADASAPAIGARAFVPQFNTYPWSIEDLTCEQTQPPSPISATVLNTLEPLRIEYPCYIPELLPRCPGDPPNGDVPPPGRAPGTFTACEDWNHPYVYHLAHTEGGCSGAPIFDDQWRLVGLHTHGWDCKNQDEYRKRNNWGTRIACIVNDAARRGFDFSEIPALQPLVAQTQRWKELRLF